MVCRKLRIADIVEGEWDEEERSAKTILGDVNEIRALGTVISKFISDDGNYSHIILDDGTETIRLKTWRDDMKRMEEVEKGDIIDVIGRLNYYNEEIYISPKIVKKISYNFWLLRHLEIIELLKNLPEGETERKEEETEIEEPENTDEIELLGTDETTNRVFETLKSEKMSREEIVEKTSLDEIDVELALRELLDEQKIKEKDGNFTAV
ncbi:MAG: OB-fold nucleic acid binding domain-containing protein [Euryarchaeota archaeon]|nr:OB-fold nucleic acid binding domain-containing protein [Euryarchaeota archaeon]